MVRVDSCKSGEIIFYAPNVHTGGGIVLMKELLEAFPSKVTLLSILDIRARSEIERLNLQNLKVIHYVKSGLLHKVLAEWILWRTSKNKSAVISFHNIPPILSRADKVFVFFQNRLLIESELSRLVTSKRRALIYLERFITAIAYRPSMIYIAQTDSMKILVSSYLTQIKRNSESHVNIIALPFQNRKIRNNSDTSNEKLWDFLYVSSAEPHKNHLNLYIAWAMLSREGYFPTLAVTVPEEDFKLVTIIKQEMKLPEIPIINLGTMKHSEVLESYLKAKAFIFPSLCESLSQPLIEAKSCHLPIIASEADFVRDVCEPIQTFDPRSPLSISRAVKRSLGIKTSMVEIKHPSIFWKTIIKIINS